MPPARTSALERHGAVLVARMFGDVTGRQVQQLHDDLRSAMGDDSSLVLDLRGTTYIDSDGVRVLFELAMWLFSTSRSLRLVVSDVTIVRRVLVLTKLDDTVPIDTNLEAALASLHQTRMDIH